MELGSDVIITSDGGFFVTGRTLSDDLPVVRAYQEDRAGGIDVFLFKVSGNNRTLEASSYVGGSQEDASWNLMVDSFGHALVFGWSGSSDFPSEDPYNGGASDVFLCRFSMIEHISGSPIVLITVIALATAGVVLVTVVYLTKRR